VDQGNPPNSTRDGASLIQWCAYYGDVSGMKFLLTKGESLQALGADLGLNAAAFHGHWRLCQFLLENRADVNCREAESGETALHAALSSHRSSQHLVAKVLLEGGADPNVPTRVGGETGAFMRDVRTRGETALHRAAAFASEETIQLLLDAGGQVDAKDANGDSPLSWASWHLRPDSILRKLCYGEHSIRPGRRSMDSYLMGTPVK
jgi:ankyrin repeat protein